MWKQGPGEVPMEGRCRVELLNESDLYVWRVFINGPPSSSPYEGGIFIVDATFPPQYPFKPPTLKFQTKIYHPNIKMDTDIVCLSEVEKPGHPLPTYKTYCKQFMICCNIHHPKIHWKPTLLLCCKSPPQNI